VLVNPYRLFVPIAMRAAMVVFASGICWLPFARLVRAALRAPVVATTTCTAIEQLA